jgi:hypothetical protein
LRSEREKQLTHWSVANTKSNYATRQDFCELFADNVESFYILSFLLTANPEMAEQCFVAGLDDCVNGISVFQEWVDCWARRLIVCCAVRLIQPRPGDTAPRMSAFRPTDEDDVPGTALEEDPFARVLALKDFERFAFVLSVLEGYPDQSCATLLRASRQEVREARARAFDHLAAVCSSQVASFS